MKTFLASLLAASAVFGSLSISNNDSAFALFNATGEEENKVISPLSVNSCLYMAFMGAEGETEEVMRNALAITIPKDTLIDTYDELFLNLRDITIANALWVAPNYPILPSYEEIFRGSIETISFAQPDHALHTINSWISDQTEGKITNLLSDRDVTKETRLVLTNATYFEGNWQSPFKASFTKPAPFTTLANDEIEVAMMRQIGTFNYFSNDDAELIALPFDTGNFATLIYLPKRADVLLDHEMLVEMISNFKMTRVSLYIPRFSARYKTPMTDALKALGMDIAFTPQADFSGIDKRGDLSLSTVVHEAVFDFDENGVVAAAATGASFNVTSSGPIPPPVIFRADHPFYYFLMDMETSTILFMGRLDSPQPLENDDSN